MRLPMLATPLTAVLFLVACSGEETAENEIAMVDPGTPVEADGATFNMSDEDLSDVPPPPPLPGQNNASISDGSGDNGSDDQVASVIPARFHGEWNQELSACGTGASDTRLRIGADELRFYESTGEVREVEIESDRVIEVTAAYRGEGQTWTNERRLSLSPDGDTLTVTGDGSTMTRSRCP